MRGRLRGFQWVEELSRQIGAVAAVPLALLLAVALRPGEDRVPGEVRTPPLLADHAHMVSCTTCKYVLEHPDMEAEQGPDGAEAPEALRIASLRRVGPRPWSALPAPFRPPIPWKTGEVPPGAL